VWRELLLWLGGVDAGRATAYSVLRNGWSLYILPGGEAEQVRAPHGQRSSPKLPPGWLRGDPACVPSQRSHAERELYRRLTLAALACVWLCSC
jgi:hypothetical protein